MKVFITGGTGFIGTALVNELVGAGYEVAGLARSTESAKKLERMGVTPVAGSLTDLFSLAEAVRSSDAVIHLAYDPDFQKHMFQSGKVDRIAIRAMAEALKGSNKPLIITAGLTGLFKREQIGTETEIPKPNMITRIRLKSEKTLFDYTDLGVKTMVVRLPPSVHGKGDRGFIPMYISRTKEEHAAYYPGTGENIWAAVHHIDAARLYRLALEKGTAGSVYHAVAEKPSIKQIAASVSQKLNVPQNSLSSFQSVRRLGSFSLVLATNTQGNNLLTRDELAWEPQEIDLLSELKQDYYY